MFITLVVLHSLLRWAVLAFALVAIVRAFQGWSGAREWTALDERAGKMLVMSVDIQTLVGLILYGVFSPITQAAFADFGTAMRDATLRFYAVEHVTLMVAAVALVHVGRVRARKALSAVAKHKAAAIFFTLALIAILIGTPWPFRAVGRPLLPSF